MLSRPPRSCQLAQYGSGAAGIPASPAEIEWAAVAVGAGATLKVVRAAERDARIARAEQLFEDELRRAGESICISSLPLIVDQVAAEAADGDEALAADIAVRLRRRAGLQTSP
jgi:hypothetical protein